MSTQSPNLVISNGVRNLVLNRDIALSYETLLL